MSRRITARAHARAGLLGNPGDVYQGKAIAVCVRNFGAEVTLEAADRFQIAPGPAETLEHDSAADAWRAFALLGCDDGIRLLRAALRRFAMGFPELEERAPDDPLLRFRMAYRTDVPRQVGLAGSSAIVIAALRALARWFDAPLEPFALSELALAAEVEDLGITAGPMDRVIQAYQGAMVMDFADPRSPASYARLDPARLPPLYLAWDPRVGEVSGRVHGEVRQRWLRGDPDVHRAVAVFPQLVDRGVACLETGDHGGFRALMDRNFDTRASIWGVRDRDRSLVAIGRKLGAAVKQCGSGGAVVGALAGEADWPEIEAAYAEAGYRTIRPQIAEGIHP